MRRPYGVFVGALLYNRFLTRLKAVALVRELLARGLQAELRMIGDVLEAV